MKRTIIFIILSMILVSSASAFFSYQFEGEASEKIPVIVNNNTQIFNITFNQKPYILSSFLYINTSFLTTDFGDSDADTTASNADDIGYANDDDYNTFAYTDGPGGGTTEYVLHTFTNITDARILPAVLKLRWYCKDFGDAVKAFAYNHNTGSYDQILNGNCNTPEYRTYTLNENYARYGSEVLINISMTANENAGAKLYDTQLLDNDDYSYEINNEDSIIYANNSEDDIETVFNFTSDARTNTDDEYLYVQYNGSAQAIFTTNITVEYLYNKTINVTLYANSTTTALNASCTYNGGSIYPLDENLYYNSSLDNQLNCTLAGYNDFSQTVTPEKSAYNYTMYSGILVLSIYDEQTDLLINDSLTVTVITNSSSINYSVTNGNVAISGLQDTEIELRYGGGKYRTRSYFITTEKYQTILDLYTVTESNSSLILFTITDEKGNPVTDDYLKVQRFFVNDNAWLLVGVEKINENGQSGMYLVPYDVPYKFLVEQDNQIIFLSDSRKIFSSDIDLRINLLDDPIESLVKLRDSLTTSLTWDNDTKIVSYFFNDASGIVVQGCVEVLAISPLTESTIGPNCTSASSATIEMNLTNLLSNNTQYTAHGYVDTSTTFSTKYTDILTDFVQLNPIYEIFGNAGLLLAYIFIITMFFVGLPFSFGVAVGYTVVALMVLNFIGLAFFGWAFIMSVCIVGFVIAAANRQ